MSYIGLKLSQKESEKLGKLNVISEKCDEHHITIIHFEDLTNIDISYILDKLTKLCAKLDPITIKVNQITCFPKGEDGFPIILEIYSKELQELRKKIIKILNSEDVVFSNTYKVYRPHITLSYSDKEIKQKEIKEISLSFNELSLISGKFGKPNKFVINFPFKNE